MCFGAGLRPRPWSSATPACRRTGASSSARATRVEFSPAKACATGRRASNPRASSADPNRRWAAAHELGARIGTSAQGGIVRCAAAIGRQNSSTSTSDLLWPVYVDSGRPLDVDPRRRSLSTNVRWNGLGCTAPGRLVCLAVSAVPLKNGRKAADDK